MTISGVAQAPAPARPVVWTATIFILWVFGTPLYAQPSNQAPRARQRVLVELRLPSDHRPEASLLGAAAVQRQRQEIQEAGARVRATLPPAGRFVRQYSTVPFIAVDVTAAERAAIQARTADVVRVVDDEIVFASVTASVPLVEADQAWDAGYTGAGWTIAILDTGVDRTHPAFVGRIAAEACFSSTVPGLSRSLCPSGQDQQVGPGAGAPCAAADCLHGTHVAGIAAANDQSSQPAIAGVAKGASLLPIQVFTQVIDPASCPTGVAPCLGAFVSDIIAALEHVYTLTLAGTHDVAAVNMSLAGSVFTAPCPEEPYAPAIDNLRGVGVATVVAAGNSGIPFGISTPACVPSAVSVGASDGNDNVAWFSNAASFLKLLAPGAQITSAVPGGGYAAFDGTSMASPHVAGAWAILKEADPASSVDEVLTTLASTGLPVTDTRFLGSTTTPRVRLFRALASLVPVVNPVPSVSALSPSFAQAGSAGVSVTIDGAGFNTFSVAQFNGAPRPTRLVTTTRIIVTLSAADLAAMGTAQVRVATPAPGGGTSGSLPFTITAPPALTVDRTIVAPSGTVTATLSNGVGGAFDYLALAATGAPDSAYLLWTYVGANVTNRSWTVTAPSAIGTYEFRYYTDSVRRATSAPITVDASAAPTPVLTSLSPATVSAGSPAFSLVAKGRGFVATSTIQWNGVARATTFISAGELRTTTAATDIATPSTATITVVTPAPGGGTSNALALTVRQAPALTVSATSAAAGSPVTVTLTNGFGGVTDWLALAAAGSANTSYVQYIYVGAGVTSRTWTVNMPSTPGTYEFRLFSNGGYTREATSPAVTVTTAGGGGGEEEGDPPALTVSTTQAVGGQSVTVTLTNGFGGATDWLALASASAPNTSYLKYIYVGSGVTTRTWTVALPAQAGSYEFRLFRNNGYVRAATSPSIVVAPAPPPPPATLALSATTVSPGSAVTVTLTNGPGGTFDWIALAASGSGVTSYLRYVYVPSGATTTTWTVAAPTTPGSYEFRLFRNNGYTLAATSPTLRVQ